MAELFRVGFHESDEDVLHVAMKFAPVEAKRPREGDEPDVPAAARNRIDEALASDNEDLWNDIFGLPDLAFMIYEYLGADGINQAAQANKTFRRTAVAFVKEQLGTTSKTFLRNLLMRSFDPMYLWWLGLGVLSAQQQYLLAVALKRSDNLISEMANRMSRAELLDVLPKVAGGLPAVSLARIELFGVPKSLSIVVREKAVGEDTERFVARLQVWPIIVGKTPSALEDEFEAVVDALDEFERDNDGESTRQMLYASSSDFYKTYPDTSNSLEAAEILEVVDYWRGRFDDKNTWETIFGDGGDFLPPVVSQQPAGYVFANQSDKNKYENLFEAIENNHYDIEQARNLFREALRK